MDAPTKTELDKEAKAECGPSPWELYGYALQAYHGLRFDYERLEKKYNELKERIPK